MFICVQKGYFMDVMVDTLLYLYNIVFHFSFLLLSHSCSNLVEIRLRAARSVSFTGAILQGCCSSMPVVPASSEPEHVFPAGTEQNMCPAPGPSELFALWRLLLMLKHPQLSWSHSSCCTQTLIHTHAYQTERLLPRKS